MTHHTRTVEDMGQYENGTKYISGELAAEMLVVLKGVQLAYWSGDALEVQAHGWADDVQAVILATDPAWYDQFNAPFRSPATAGE